MGKFILYLASTIIVIILVIIGINYIKDFLQENKLELKMDQKTKMVSTGITEKYLKNVSVIDINTSQPKVVIEFDEQGKKILEDLLRKNKDIKLNLETDGKKIGEYSIAINAAEGKIILSGFVDAKEAQKIVDLIKSKKK